MESGHAPLVVVMWVLYAIGLLLHGTRPILIGAVIAAISIAVFLIFQRDRNDKIIGWVAIGIGVIGLFVAFSAGGGAPAPTPSS
jgi:hypothetical protein